MRLINEFYVKPGKWVELFSSAVQSSIEGSNSTFFDILFNTYLAI